MSEMVQDMLSIALRAYDESSTDLAADVRVRDVKVDALNKEVLKTAIAGIQTDSNRAEADIYVIILARGLERAGDQVVNIARHIHQIVTGEDIKAAD